MYFEDLIKNLKSDLKNERLHMMFYLLNASTITGGHRQEYRELFLEEAASEMNHVKEFQDFIIGLGGKFEDEDVGNLNVPVFTDTEQMIRYAYNMEMEVVRNYANRIKESETLADYTLYKWVEVFLEKQIEHSRADADNLKQILTNFK
jgi:bacterioferritin (cytochrome b1)